MEWDKVVVLTMDKMGLSGGSSHKSKQFLDRLEKAQRRHHYL